jgi:predicted nucleic acid-binding protein
VDIVVDASVIIAVIANEPNKSSLLRLTEGSDLIAPSSIHWEIGNAFSAMIRRGRIALHHALEAIEAYHRIPIRFVEVELDAALKLSAEHDIYAYDAYLIRCALKYNVPLLTLDRGLQYAAESEGVEVIEVSK